MRSETGSMKCRFKWVLGILLFVLTMGVYSGINRLTVFAEIVTSEDSPKADAYSVDEAVEKAKAFLKDREEEFSIYLYVPVDPDTAFDVLYDEIPEKILEHTGVPTEGDYWKVILRSRGMIMSGGQKVGDNYRYQLVFKTGYLTTQEEEAEMREILDGIYAEMDLDGKSEYEKALIIYDYVTSIVAVDEEHYGDATYTKQFSPYFALTEKKGVCEAYASLLYRMLLEQGLDARIVEGGTKTGVAHAWNIVRIDSRYYSLDASLDNGGMHRYFLYGTGKDNSHYLRSEYTKEEFTEKYPISEISYSEWLEATFTGWKEVDGAWYYYIEGQKQTGWLTLDNVRYYLDDQGARVTGGRLIDGKWYYFSKDGVMHTGWLKKSGNRYYFDENGIRVTGLQQIGGKVYYFNGKGVMCTGWLTKGGKTYYFGEDGVRRTGRQVIDGKTYYFSTKGVMTVGWLTIKGKTFYFNEDGTMQFGWKEIDGKTYGFNKKGIMITGWLNYKNRWYYLQEDGSMMVGGTLEIGGEAFIFNSKGICQNR